MGKDQMHYSTNAISLLSAFIFPRHFKYYFFGILVFSLETTTICQNWVTKKRQVGWMCCCLSSRTRAFAGRSKTQKLFLFTSVGGTNSPTSATETLRLCFTIFLRISAETFRWQISCCFRLLFQAMPQTTFSWFASNWCFIRSFKQRINWYYQICQLLAFEINSA